MLIPAARSRELLVLLCLLFSSSLLPARGQDQRPARKPQVPPRVKANLPWHKWLDEDVRYIISDQERSDFLNLTTDKQRDELITDFWNRRNPTPESSENPFKEEHYRRFAYANTHFAAGVPGWKTDRGRFYIMYGPPDSIDAKPGFAPPSETWHYMFIEGLGRNVALTFKDECVCGKYEFSGADSDSRPLKIFVPPWQ
jgi:GWxTD domain-containing protein